ncbi:MAG: A24 family peptidase [Oscillospiraceae bacterium]|nr:A24 family peptidase [Oscillospiraceae bacterium]
MLEIIASIAVILILLAITVIDFRKMEIPDLLVVALVPFAVFAAFDGRPLWHRILGFFIISVPMLVIALIIDSAFGGGDIKLIAVCGFMLGFDRVLLAMFIAILLGGTVAVALLALRKKEKGAHIPFGPYICVGVAAAMLFGDNIIGWYLGLFGL